MSTLNELHPLPWQVKYRQRFDTWHPKSRPYIVDANHALVVEMNGHVGHPGDYDAHADGTAQAIVNAVNTQYVARAKREFEAMLNAFAIRAGDEHWDRIYGKIVTDYGYACVGDVLPKDYESILHELESESNGSL